MAGKKTKRNLLRKVKLIHFIMQCIKPVLCAMVMRCVQDINTQTQSRENALDDYLRQHRKQIEKKLPKIDNDNIYMNIIFPPDGSPTQLEKWDLTLLKFVLEKIVKIGETISHYLTRLFNIRAELRKPNSKNCTRIMFKSNRKVLFKMRSKCYKKLKDDILKYKVETDASRIDSKHKFNEDTFLSEWHCTEEQTIKEESEYGQQRFERIEQLLFLCACDVMRELVLVMVKRNRKKYSSLDDYLSKNKPTTLRRLGSHQVVILFPGNNKKTDLSKWDISLLSSVLVDIFQLDSNDNDIGIEQSIIDIREARNKLLHYPARKLSEMNYTFFHKTITKSLNQCLTFINDEKLTDTVKNRMKQINFRTTEDEEISIILQKIYIQESEVEMFLQRKQKVLDDMCSNLKDILNRHGREICSELEVELVIRNCPEDQESTISDLIVAAFNEKVNIEQTGVKYLDKTEHKDLKIAVSEIVEMFKSKGVTVLRAVKGSVLLNIHCKSFSKACELYNSCKVGRYTFHLRNLQQVVRKRTGIDLTLTMAIYENEMLQCINRTVSSLQQSMRQMEVARLPSLNPDKDCHPSVKLKTRRRSGYNQCALDLTIGISGQLNSISKTLRTQFNIENISVCTAQQLLEDRQALAEASAKEQQCEQEAAEEELHSEQDELRKLSLSQLQQLQFHYKESQPDSYLFNKALLDGQERDRFVRINVVGNFAQGKTSLIRRLLNQPIGSVVSTDGIDVHIRKCKIKDAAVWELYEAPLDEDCHRRFAKIEKSNDGKTVMKPGGKGEYSGIENNLTQTKETPGSLQDQAIRLNFHEQDAPLLVKKLFQKTNIKDIEPESDFFANIWDFGGQYIYYATHQIFHSRDAIYLLVFDLRQDLESFVIDSEFPERRQKIKNCLKFWVCSIDTFVGTNDGKQPLIIFVGTHKDKFDGDIDDKFDKVIDLFVGTKAINHIYKTPFAVTNVDATDKSIGELRETIYEIAKQNFAHRIVPAKWKPLEKALLSTRKEKNILTFQDVMELARANMISAQDEGDLKLFLNYHHAKGTLIYFDEDALDKYIIATPSYLVDAFKCIFTSKDVCKWNRNLHPLWKKFETTAVLERGLVNEVWKCDQSNDFIDNADILLMFLQRHRIISELLQFDNTTETVKGLGKYLVPSMLRQQCDEENLKAFIGRKCGSVVSLGFKLEHNSVLENIYMRITAAALGRWPSIKYNGENFLFKNTGFYRLDGRHVGQIALKDEKGLELTVYNLCVPNEIEMTVCDRFRRYIESAISYDFKRLHGDLNTKPYEYYFTCNHKEHGGYGSKEVLSHEDLESLIPVGCPDYLDHSVAAGLARAEWFLNETIVEDQIIPDRRVTNKDLSRIAESLGKNWMLLGVNLGFSVNEIERMEIDYATSGVATSIFYMLFEWSERNSDTATFNVLIKAMKECEQLSVNWDKIRNIVDEF